MQTYNNPSFDEHRTIIRNLVDRKGWSGAQFFGGPDITYLQYKLNDRIEEGSCPENLTAEMWLTIWSELKQTAEKSKRLDERIKQSTLVAANADNEMHVPDNEQGSWQLYKKSLSKNGWSEESINELEQTTEGILKKLNINTTENGPIKGLVIGNVQSGKTANMSGLMAMAADWGWNVFIVLSGIIENLRKQTEDRLISDLDKPGNLAWTRISKPSLQSDSAERTHQLHLGEDDSKRYLTVCLKNRKRLQNLESWLKENPHKLKQMRILIIDDEADQAGINTKDISTDERTKINNEIRKLVNIGNKIKPQSVNYISYTATPYANFLNEAKIDSLYPKDFIGVLNPAKEYFGPKQIFGLDDTVEYRGLRIIREISVSKELDEEKHIKDIHKGRRKDIPNSLKNAIHWFFCATAVMRYRKYKKPISMLIHTSQAQKDHANIAESIQRYITSFSTDDWVKLCNLIYDEERTRMTLEDFELDFEGYPLKVKDYPSFNRIKEEIIRLKDQISHIPLGDEGKLDYHDGIHLCIDNCANNGFNDEDMHVRLAYPDVPVDSAHYPSPAPAFIVIGGSTLSRGLTIEGLVSTYFLRTTKTADTLMQMGRWFGYRKGYEMLPRIWMTNDTQEKYRFLALLDEELREELKVYSLQGDEPALYGPKVKNSPKVSWMLVTAKNRSQSAIPTNIDFSGTTSQTTFFNNNSKELQENIEVTEKFICQLGTPKITRTKKGLFWENIDFDLVKNHFLTKFKFNQRSRTFKQIDKLCEWYEEKAKEADFTGWNILISGIGKVDSDGDNVWKIANHSIGKIKRTRLGKLEDQDEGFINIGVLRAPSDLYEDIDEDRLALLPEDHKDFTMTSNAYVREVRKKAGLGKTPQLVIYRIDKDSNADPMSGTRTSLKADEDIIGVSLYIPGQENGKSLAASLTIELDSSETKYENIEGGE
ncbi:Z1 domain-containing protein [Cytobacillus gottheilii]|uniref:Z1 domain-containing protein n=1 Tax=Cytobacillus gottheilii TaxID=859144 RepID=UPI0009BC40F5|nr:Z1 domain-containing protein [Cytobacillus gottheilii]